MPRSEARGSVIGGRVWNRPDGRFAGAAMVLIILAACLPGFFSIPVVDRDEARFAQASRQMFESLAWPDERLDRRPIVRGADGRLSGGLHAGGWATPMVGERPRLAKPPLVYWLQASSAAVLSGFDPLADRIWHYRLPSLLSAIAACLITWRMGVGLGWARAGWLAGVLLGACPMVVWDAHQSRADQLLLAVTTGAMAALLSLWRGRDRPAGRRGLLVALAFWVMIGAGVLTKGPITPMVALLAAVGVSVLAGRWRWLGRTRPVLGVVVLAAMIGPWLWATADAVGWDTLRSVWLDETLGRSVEAREGHWGPPGYHLVLLVVLFWPGSLMTLGALRRAVGAGMSVPVDGRWTIRWRSRMVGHDGVLFLLAWIAPSWLVFELVGTKLPHYTLPLYPPVALLTAWAVVGVSERADARAHAVAWPGLAVWAVLGVLLASAAPAVAIGLGAPPWVAAATVVLGLTSALLIVAACRDARVGRPVRAHASAVAAGVLVSIGLLHFALPGTPALRVTGELSGLIALVPPGAPVATADYREDSLAFVTRGRLEKITPDAAHDWAAAHRAGVLILDAGADAPPGWRELGRVGGVNYSKGDRVDLRVWIGDDLP